MTVEQNHVLELAFAAHRIHDDPFRAVDLTVEFTAPDGTVRQVPAFRAGGGRWKVRYASAVPGTHRYRTVGADLADAGLAGSGSFEVLPYAGDNPLYRHGAVGRRGDDMHLRHADGTPFFWLGDTWWMCLTERLAWPDDFHALLADRVAKGFTVVQLVAGLYPDMTPFDERGANEAGFPWDQEFHAVNPAYFDMADRRVAALVEAGVTPCVVGSWGFFMGFAGKEALRRHWRELVARWAAYPVVWCLAGEANMQFYDSDLPEEEHLRRSRRDWCDMAFHLRSLDPFDRLVTIHPTANGHEQIEDESLLDLDMLQTGHGGPTSLVPTMKAVRAAVARGKLPVLVAEANYEGISGSSFADVQRYTFLSSFFLGACGHTYGANGIWQVNARAHPYGVSPHGASWGETTWDEAMALPGSGQVGRCARYLTKFEWWRFESHPEWVESPCTGEALDGHFAVGIPGEVRLLYKPWFGGDFWGEVRFLGLQPDARYRAERMDPIRGAVKDLGEVVADASGTWRTPRPDFFQDWIFALVREE